MKIYQAWEELFEWLQSIKAGDRFYPELVLDKMDELEMKHE